MYKLVLFFGAVSMLLVAGACNLLTVNESSSEYPTVYAPLKTGALKAMNSEYQSANNDHICSTLNRYGFTGYSELFFIDGESPCANRKKVRKELQNIDTLITTAKKSLLKNKKYTGVEDTAKLMVQEIMPINGCTICEGPGFNNVPVELKITFGPQFIDTTEVLGTTITVFVDAEGVNRIWGNRYAEFSRPMVSNYEFDDVKEEIIGWQIEMRTFTGENELYTVRAEDVGSTPKRVILPHINEQEKTLAMRICWAVPIGYEYGNGDFSGWIAYVDSEEGILVELAEAQQNQQKYDKAF